MLSLLKAEYRRLFKNALFYCSFPVTFVLLIIFVYLSFGYTLDVLVRSPDMYWSVDYYFLVDAVLPIAFAAVFIPVFIGREFSDKTINNKIICGAKRSHIYIAEYIVCTTAMVIYQLFVDISMLILCKIILSRQNHSIFDTPKAEMFLQKFGFLAIIFVSCALFVLVCMCVGSRIKSIIAIILAVFLLNSISSTVSMNVLSDGEKTAIQEEVYPWMQEDYGRGTVDNAEPEFKTFEEAQKETFKNSLEVCLRTEAARGQSLKGIKKIVFLYFDDSLPMCQLMNASDWTFAAKASPRVPLYVLYNILNSAFLLALGIIIFERKELN